MMERKMKSTFDPWTDEPEIVVAGYRCRTDFKGFIEALRAGKTLILCRFCAPPFFSRDRRYFSASLRAGAEKFFQQKMAWIEPESTEAKSESQ